MGSSVAEPERVTVIAAASALRASASNASRSFISIENSRIVFLNITGIVAGEARGLDNEAFLHFPENRTCSQKALQNSKAGPSYRI